MLDTKLLLEIKDRILAEPHLFDIGEWSEERPCGTVCCLAGWAYLLKHGSLITEDQTGPPYLTFSERGAATLGLDRYQGNGLFHVSSWPDPYRTRMLAAYQTNDNAQCRRDQALVAAELIDAIVDRGIWWRVRNEAPDA